jgi:serine/threonine protein kinase/class 3 adenylate cyclase
MAGELSQSGSVLEIGHVLFMDLVGYSNLPMVEARQLLGTLQESVWSTADFKSAKEKNQLISLPTGDGVALVFFGDPEAPVRCALQLQLTIRNDPTLRLRMGIHSGPVYRLSDINLNRNVAGSGINIAQRVMDCGDAGHVLTSSNFAELLMQLGTWSNFLHDIGEAEVKHGIRLHLFNLYGEEFGNSQPPARLIQANTPPSPSGHTTALPLVGQVISHYEVIKLLGRGGMGAVYEARDKRLGRHVALKFFANDQPHTSALLDRFLQEARAASCLSHPNISIVHDVGEHEGRPFIVMELLEGQNLKHRLQTRPLTTEEVLELGIQTAQGLEYAHSQGIIHRDIKPANLFVTSRGQLKILDFGLAKFIVAPRTVAEVMSFAATVSGPTEVGLGLTAPGEFVGTVAYMSPEQARGMPLDLRTDLFSFGVVLYEMATGTRPFGGDTSAVIFEAILNRVPESPVRRNPQLPAEFEPIVNRALAKDREERYHTAGEIAADLRRIANRTSSRTMTLPAPVASPAAPGGEIVLLYKRNAHPDVELLAVAEKGLRAQGYQVFVDRHLVVGVDWAREIERRISGAEAVVVFLSAASVQSEMLAYEIQIAREAAQRSEGKPLILPVRVQFNDPLPEPLAATLGGIQWAQWDGPQDNDPLLTEIRSSLGQATRSLALPVKLEAVGGAVPLDSSFYIVRPTDEEFHTALSRHDTIVLVKGARQMGKTSLLARGLQEARKADYKLVLTDFQKLSAAHFQSVESFFRALAVSIADQLDLDVEPDISNPRRGPSMNFERFLRREVLKNLSAHLVWAMDEVDRLFTCSYGSEVFGLFRSWHNERSLDPTGPWQKLTLAIAYATEAHLFITDVNQSPFNVGTRLTLSDFTLEQVSELNNRYGTPLEDPRQLMRFYELLGGQPYLTRRGLHELASRRLSFGEFENQATRDEGPFGDHLRRILVSLAQDQTLCEAMRGVLSGRPGSNPELFYRLRSSGVVTGESVRLVVPRCRLYEVYLKRHLL